MRIPVFAIRSSFPPCSLRSEASRVSGSASASGPISRTRLTSSRDPVNGQPTRAPPPVPGSRNQASLFIFFSSASVPPEPALAVSRSWSRSAPFTTLLLAKLHFPPIHTTTIRFIGQGHWIHITKQLKPSPRDHSMKNPQSLSCKDYGGAF